VRIPPGQPAEHSNVIRQQSPSNHCQLATLWEKEAVVRSITVTTKSGPRPPWTGAEGPRSNYASTDAILAIIMVPPNAQKRDRRGPQRHRPGPSATRSRCAPESKLPKVLYWNAGGISRTKFAEFLLTIDKEKTDIYCISEAGQHAQEGHKDLSDMQAPGFTLHLLEAKRPGRKVACGMIIGVKSSLVSKFSVVHTMGTQDDNIEIACVEVWMGDRKTRKTTVYMVYNPPLNKPAALESLPIARNTIIIAATSTHQTKNGTTTPPQKLAA
jgi:hypothetical protein